MLLLEFIPFFSWVFGFFNGFIAMVDPDILVVKAEESSGPDSARTEQEMDVSADQSINQSKGSLVPHPLANSTWFSYMRQRVQRSGHPLSRVLLERQRGLFRTLSEDHSYGQRPAQAGEGKAASSIMRTKKTLFLGHDGLGIVAGG